MRRSILLATLASLAITPFEARSEYLFNGYLEPTDLNSTNYYGWGRFFYPRNTGSITGNEPTIVAGPTPVPKISQHAWGGPGSVIITSSGGIYSVTQTLDFSLAGTSAAPLTTLLFQFATVGSLVDFSSIYLEYTDGTGTHQLSALEYSEYIREYREASAPQGFGAANRNAIQWDLEALGISGVTDYTIKWKALGPHMSFLQASLDVGKTGYAVESIVPATRKWDAASGSWSNGANWVGGQSSVQNGNVHFVNTTNAEVNLDTNRTVAEVQFDTNSDVTISSDNDSTLTLVTGVTTNVGATGTYTFDTEVALDALNLMQIDGGTVEFNQSVSGDYGIYKMGAGTLHFKADNTFGRDNNVVGLEGGVLRFDGKNEYNGDTIVISGTLIIGTDALAGQAGALGNSSSRIYLGPNEASYENKTGDYSTTFIIDGNHTMGRDIELGNGNLRKTLSVVNADEGAVFSGDIYLSPYEETAANNVFLTTGSSTDVAIYSGAITGGTAGHTLTVSGPGTVRFTGQEKTYRSNTVVDSGILEIATDFTGNGNMTVKTGARLAVNGTLAGAGSLLLEGGSVLSGTGTVERVFTVGNGATVAPGNSPGTLHTVSQTWEGGGAYLWSIADADAGAGIGWSSIEIDGTLNITATGSDRFQLQLNALNIGGTPGLPTDFDVFADDQWLILTADTITGFSSSAFELDLGFFALVPDIGIFSLEESGGSLYLNYYAAVPEPGTWALMLGGGAIAYALRRRRKAA